VHDVGVLLVDADPDSARHALRLRAHWEDLAGPEDAAYLAALERDFQDKIAETGRAPIAGIVGGFAFARLRVTEREAVRWIRFRAWRTGSSNGTSRS
jgi:hypothetical protein